MVHPFATLCELRKPHHTCVKMYPESHGECDDASERLVQISPSYSWLLHIPATRSVGVKSRGLPASHHVCISAGRDMKGKMSSQLS